MIMTTTLSLGVIICLRSLIKVYLEVVEDIVEKRYKKQQGQRDFIRWLKYQRRDKRPE